MIGSSIKFRTSLRDDQAKHGETVLLDCDWSRAVSANPYLSFVFNGAKAGDMITISWIDNLGESDEAVKELR
ncbi:MAG: thiosulfate oxidation carrier complex protein SoxZ [Gammaproteobacteria bacterium]